jgi:hypothetical protein
MCSAAERGDTAGGIRESGDMLTLKLFDEMKGSPSLRSVRIEYRSAMQRVKGPKVNKPQPRTRRIYAKNDISTLGSFSGWVGWSLSQRLMPMVDRGAYRASSLKMSSTVESYVAATDTG